MSSSSHLFADRLVNIAVTGPLLRLELGTMHAPAAEGEKPQLLPSQTLVMPLEGFLSSFEMMEALVKKLIADGVVKAKSSQEQLTQRAEMPHSRKKK